jgi:peptide-O-fucosyltransferase
MEKLILKYKYKSILIDRAEVMLHENYGDVEYWKCRKSMRFARNLVEESDKFREENLNSNDIEDKTLLDKDWTKIKVNL